VANYPFQSTPASEEAGDVSNAIGSPPVSKFQSTPASEEAGDGAGALHRHRDVVSIHARLRGSGRQQEFAQMQARTDVSIHARLRGSGRRCAPCTSGAPVAFQSTPASEEAGDMTLARPHRQGPMAGAHWFQSTPASEEAGDLRH